MNERIWLIPSQHGKDNIGAAWKKPDTGRARAVWARAISIGSREYYTASAAGVRIDVKFELHRHEYHDEPYMQHGSQVYQIERSYINGGKIELTGRAVDAWR